MRLCSFCHIWTNFCTWQENCPFPCSLNNNQIPNLNNQIWARKLLHDYKFLLVKYGMQRKIWVKRRMVGRNMVEEERIGQNMGGRSGPIYISIPPKTKRCSTNTQKTISPPPGYRLLPCWLSTNPSPKTPPHLHHHPASILRETWPEVGRRYQS